MLTLSEYIFAPADALPGVLRWQSRLWQLVTKLRAVRQHGDVPIPSSLKKKELAEARKIWENMNYAIQEVATDTLPFVGRWCENNSQRSSSLNSIHFLFLLFSRNCSVCAK